jgi:hypothetical protein
MVRRARKLSLALCLQGCYDGRYFQFDRLHLVASVGWSSLIVVTNLICEHAYNAVFVLSATGNAACTVIVLQATKGRPLTYCRLAPSTRSRM